MTGGPWKWNQEFQGITKESGGREGVIRKAHCLIGIEEAFPVISKLIVGSALFSGEHFFCKIV